MTDFTTYILTPPSINGERARWILDYYDISWIEERRTLAPRSLIPALRYARRAKGSKYLYAVGDAGKVVFRDPKKLAEYLDPSSDESRRLVVPVDAAVNEAFTQSMTLFHSSIRSWAYGVTIPNRRLFMRIMTAGVPITQKWFLVVAHPLIKLLASLASSADAAEKNLQSVKKAFDAADAIFADGREFVNGDRLTYADLALACSTSPAIMPPEYGGSTTCKIYPPVEDLPDQLKELVAQFRERPTGKYVLKLFRNYRIKPIS